MARMYFASLSEVDISSLESFIGEATGCATLPSIKAKCRELSRSDSLILTSPHSSTYNCHTVYIVSKKGYITGQVKTKLTSLGLNIIGGTSLTLSILQSCYRFTLIARLAPKWNEISNWIVKGSDIFQTGRSQGMKLDIGLTTDNIMLTVNAFKVTLNFLKPEDLQVSTVVLSKFKSDPCFVLNETCISSNQCIVLPNFTQGYVYSVSHTVPQSCGFDNYDKIRLHWKKQYGFVLPSSQSLFYQVFFKFNTSNIFSYPGCCVCRSKPIAVSSKDIDDISTSFISDVQSRMTSLCGSPLKFSKRPFAPTIKLQLSDKPPHNSKIPTNVRPVAIRPKVTNVTLGFPNLPPISTKPVALAPIDDITNKENECYVPVFKGSTGASYDQRVPGPLAPIKRGCNDNLQQQRSSKRPCLSLNSVATKPAGFSTCKGQFSDRGINALSSKTVDVVTSSKEITSSIERHHHSSVTSSQVVPNTDMLPNSSSQLTMETSANTKVPVAGGKKSNTTGSSIDFDGIPANTVKEIKKAKIPFMKNWLEKNDIRFRSKDKKEDLMRLIVEHIKTRGVGFVLT